VVPLRRRLLAELLGTLLLVAVVVGSGIAASRLSPLDRGLQLLENAVATSLGLFVLIVVLAPLSGAHLNPLVSLVDAALGRRRWIDAAAYMPAQVIGAAVGAVLANLMFGLPAVTVSTNERLTLGHALAEVVATAGLIVVVFVLARTGRDSWTPSAVAAWIGSAYFFTSSTAFANPAVTIGRMLSDTFAGIAPASALGYVAAQLVGAAVGLGVVVALVGRRTTT
jgi:glycerol uptake facilitator-like aquaporin